MAESDRRPNIVLIIMDDLAYGDLGCHGNQHTRTPRLDQLHHQSSRFTRTCSFPVSTPARASLMTGRYPYRTRAIDTYCGRSMMDPDEITLAELLRDAGYRTGIFGKWHLGDNYPMRAMDQGFEEALVHNGGGLRQPGNIGFDGYFNPQLMHNGQLVDSEGYCTDIFTDHALRFIEQHRDEPFFVYLATNAPHTPLEVPAELAEHYREAGLNETFARVYGMVENIDTNVGRVMDQLDRLGLSDDTIVIYTSDHGPCGSASHEGEVRFNAGLRAHKGTVYQGGIQVPSFWRWPGRFASGVDIDRITSPIDILPTLCEAAGVALPEGVTIDGTSMLGLLDGRVAADRWPGRTLFSQWHRGDVPVRFRNAAVMTDQFKLVDGRELYDLCADPHEQRDIAVDRPDVVAELRQSYEQWFDDVSAERGYDPPAIVIGTDHENPTVLTRQDWRVHGPDGWGDEHKGYWQVRYAQGRQYRITVTFTPDDQPADLILFDGQRSHKVAIEPGQDHATLPPVESAPGSARVEAWLVGPNGHRSARQIHFAW
jgi:arylsulfatase A-like enzyme